ncbi:MAG: HipA family kinase [Candidatus Kapaibacterium sp.]
MNIWKIATPNCIFISSRDNYLIKYAKNSFDLSAKWFEKTCFGSQYLRFAKDVDDFIAMAKNNIIKINKIDFLKIALFDLWISNEDRRAGNPNIIAEIKKDKIILNAIDHDKILNSNSGMPLFLISRDETILKHNLFRALYKKNEIIKYDIFSDIIYEFENIIELCARNIDEILSNVPVDWNLDIKSKRDYLFDNLFDPGWIKAVSKSFKEYCSFYLR